MVDNGHTEIVALYINVTANDIFAVLLVFLSKIIIAIELMAWLGRAGVIHLIINNCMLHDNDAPSPYRSRQQIKSHHLLNILAILGLVEWLLKLKAAWPRMTEYLR